MVMVLHHPLQIKFMYLEYSKDTEFQLSNEMVQRLIIKSQYLNPKQKKFLSDIFAELRAVFEECMKDTPTKSYLEMFGDLRNIADKIETSNIVSVKLEKWHSFYEKEIAGYSVVFEICRNMGFSVFSDFKVSDKGVLYGSDKVEQADDALKELVLGGITQIIGHLLLYIYSETIRKKSVRV